MPNFYEPTISEITASHFFVAVIVRRVLRVNHDVPVVIRRTRVVAPDIGFRYLMKRIVGAGWQCSIVGKNFAYPENPSRGSAVALVFSETGLVLAGDAAPPGETVFPKQHRHRSRMRLPLAGDPLEKIQTAMGSIPIGSQPNDDLGAVIRESGGMSVARDKKRD